MSDENTETVEQILSEMEGHRSDLNRQMASKTEPLPSDYEQGYGLASGKWARRLRAALERQQ